MRERSLIGRLNPHTENRSWAYRKFNTGGINRDDPDNPLDNKEHVLMAFFKNQLSAVINNKFWKAVILLAFAVYLLGAGYGLTQMEEGLERRKLSKEDSYSVRFFDLEDEFYREFPYRMQVIIAGEMNYSDPVSVGARRDCLSAAPLTHAFYSFTGRRFSSKSSC